jgi:hypothetical protein
VQQVTLCQSLIITSCAVFDFANCRDGKWLTLNEVFESLLARI